MQAILLCLRYADSKLSGKVHMLVEKLFAPLQTYVYLCSIYILATYNCVY